MTATASSVLRTNDPAGDPFKTYDDSAGIARKVQAVVEDPDVSGRLLSRSATAGVAEDTRVAKATAGILFQCDVLLDPAVVTDRWLLIFDKSTAPIAADVPVFRAKVAGGFASIDMGRYGIELATGVAVALSTTVDTLTLPGGAGDGFFQIGYV